MCDSYVKWHLTASVSGDTSSENYGITVNKRRSIIGGSYSVMSGCEFAAQSFRVYGTGLDGAPQFTRGAFPDVTTIDTYMSYAGSFDGFGEEET